MHTPTHPQHSNIHKKYLKHSFPHFSTQWPLPTDGPMEGQSLLQSCVSAIEKWRESASLISTNDVDWVLNLAYRCFPHGVLPNITKLLVIEFIVCTNHQTVTTMRMATMTRMTISGRMMIPMIQFTSIREMPNPAPESIRAECFLVTPQHSTICCKRWRLLFYNHSR